MANIVQTLTEKGLAHPPKWLPDNLVYATITGSTAYGVANDESDFDIYGICIPTREELFPHLRGEIIGFGGLKHGTERFRVYQQHHIFDSDALGGKGRNYDLTIYNIVDYFQLAMEGSPNMVDTLFTPQNCVLHATQVGQMIRENRKMFLHRGLWHTFKGYAFQQIKKMGSHKRVGKRKKEVEQHGFDRKFAYHVVRLILEVEQILTEGDLDLQRNREQLKAIRRGEWTKEQIEEYFAKKELELESVYNKSTLPWGPSDGGLQDRIKQLLFQCLEHHYGSLDKCVVNENAAANALRELGRVFDKHRSLLD